MKTKSEAGEQPRNHSRSPWAVVALLAVGILIGNFWQGSTEPMLFAFDPQATYGNDEDSDYTFIPFRRNLWVIDHANDTIQFYMFPAAEARPIQPSRLYNIDRNEFPADVVRYQVSDHNVTSFLWILNPETGKGRYIKALRDGKIEESRMVNVKETK